MSRAVRPNGLHGDLCQSVDSGLGVLEKLWLQAGSTNQRLMLQAPPTKGRRGQKTNLGAILGEPEAGHHSGPLVTPVEDSAMLTVACPKLARFQDSLSGLWMKNNRMDVPGQPTVRSLRQKDEHVVCLALTQS